MFLKRSGSGLSLRVVVAMVAIGTLGLLVLGIAKFHDAHQRMNRFYRESVDYKQLHLSTKAELDVVYDNKKNIEKMLQQEKVEHKRTKDEFAAHRLSAEAQLSKEKQEANNRFASLNQDHKILRDQHDSVQKEYDELLEQHKILQKELSSIKVESKTKEEEYKKVHKKLESEKFALKQRVDTFNADVTRLRFNYTTCGQRMRTAESQSKDLKQKQAVCEKNLKTCENKIKQTAPAAAVVTKPTSKVVPPLTTKKPESNQGGEDEHIPKGGNGPPTPAYQPRGLPHPRSDDVVMDTAALARGRPLPPPLPNNPGSQPLAVQSRPPPLRAGGVPVRSPPTSPPQWRVDLAEHEQPKWDVRGGRAAPAAAQNPPGGAAVLSAGAAAGQKPLGGAVVLSAGDGAMQNPPGGAAGLWMEPLAPAAPAVPQQWSDHHGGGGGNIGELHAKIQTIRASLKQLKSRGIGADTKVAIARVLRSRGNDERHPDVAKAGGGGAMEQPGASRAGADGADAARQGGEERGEAAVRAEGEERGEAAVRAEGGGGQDGGGREIPIDSHVEGKPAWEPRPAGDERGRIIDQKLADGNVGKVAEEEEEEEDEGEAGPVRHA
ncbi:PREDICTED: translation initiation factor IF-2-like [Priapulus caudatus]|uniref:Translation initiation factor IF-2-like n=1 Tax=Priapulus caudatus TaxID=37621 RepID=A0ABM1EDX4_PRICU|nr:PREDICTED: translation initiation factor IF-2-like [Priapulus caudatus]